MKNLLLTVHHNNGESSVTANSWSLKENGKTILAGSFDKKVFLNSDEDFDNATSMVGLGLVNQKRGATYSHNSISWNVIDLKK